MENGELGPHGQHVMRTAKDIDLKVATIPLHFMEEDTAKVWGQFKSHVLEVIVQGMVIGDPGHRGQHVLALLELEGDIVITLPLQPGENTVQDTALNLQNAVSNLLAPLSL